MENTTRLLERHLDALEARHPLVVGVDDPSLGRLLPHTRIHSDSCDLAGDGATLVPELAPDRDLILIVMPKAREQLRFWLAALAGQLDRPCEVWLVGPARGGVRGGASELEAAADHVQTLDSARHCKLYGGWLRPAAFRLDDWRRHWHHDRLEVASWPGVFSHGRLDEGTLLLLQAMADRPPAGRVLDLGCGAGILTAWLARGGARVTATDDSAAALAATRATLEVNGLEAEVLGGDLYGPVAGRFDAIVTNPPFHEGTARTLEVTRRLISEAPAYLREGGELWLVANQNLPYGEWLRGAFGRVEVAMETSRFRVWHAAAPRSRR